MILLQGGNGKRLHMVKDSIFIEVNANDIQIYRTMALIGIISFPLMAYLYSHYFSIENYLNIFMFILPILFLLFTVATFISRLNRYLYLMAVIIVNLTTFYFIWNMNVLGLPLNMVLTVAIAISALANIYKTERAVEYYLLTMIGVSIITIVLNKPYTIITALSITILIIWPSILHFMMRSRFSSEKELERNRRFLEMVFSKGIDPVIIIDKAKQTVVDCSLSTLGYLVVANKNELIGKSVEEINEQLLGHVFEDSLIRDLREMTEMNQEVKLEKEGQQYYYRISTKNFVVQTKVYTMIHVLDISIEKRQSEAVYQLAHTDELTGISNRRMAMIQLDEAITSAEKTNTMIGLLTIDIDKFKDVNDQYGHDFGDALLIAISRRLRKALDAEDVVSRIGGDEFMVILNNMESEDMARKVAERLRDIVKKPIKLNQQTIYSSLSIGVAIYPKDGNHKSDLMKRSDIALYQAKEAGRNCHKFFANNVLLP